MKRIEAAAGQPVDQHAHPHAGGQRLAEQIQHRRDEDDGQQQDEQEPDHPCRGAGTPPALVSACAGRDRTTNRCGQNLRARRGGHKGREQRAHRHVPVDVPTEELYP